MATAYRVDLAFTVFKDAFRDVARSYDAPKKMALVPCPRHKHIRYTVLASEGITERDLQRVQDVLGDTCPRHPSKLDVR